MGTAEERAVRRALARIEIELEAIRGEGLESPGCWYARDRFGAIAEIAAKAARGEDAEVGEVGGEGAAAVRQAAGAQAPPDQGGGGG